jgi:hypothetical protein
MGLALQEFASNGSLLVLGAPVQSGAPSQIQRLYAAKDLRNISPSLGN